MFWNVKYLHLQYAYEVHIAGNAKLYKRTVKRKTFTVNEEISFIKKNIIQSRTFYETACTYDFDVKQKSVKL